MEENNTSENKEEKKKLAGSNPGPGPMYKFLAREFLGACVLEF
jgi:hypothetical protein